MSGIFTDLYLPAINWNSKKIEFVARSKIFYFSKMVQGYGNRSADMCLVTQAIGQARLSLSK